MAGTRGNALILFVAGEPDTGLNPLKDVQSPYIRLFMGAGLPNWKKKREQSAEADSLVGLEPAEGGQPELRIPADQVGCIRDVARIARAEGTTVRIVDVNRAELNQALVDRWVGPNDVLPVLVRADGAKLVGAEQFVPRKIQRFIRGN
jgi:hypothetical protein